MSTIRDSSSGHQAPGWMQAQGTGNVFLDILSLGLGLVIVGTGLLSLIFVLAILYRTCSFWLTIFLQGAPADILNNCLENAIAGACIGLIVVFLRSFRKKPEQGDKSFMASLFAQGVLAPEWNAIFFGRLVLGSLVGILVGLWSGGSGAVGFFQFFTASSSAVLHNKAYPLFEMITNLQGGSGGSFDWFWFILLLIALVIAAFIIGCVSGFAIHLLCCIFGAILEESTKRYVIHILINKQLDEWEEPHPVEAGIVRGFWIGLLVGCFQAIFTGWGILKFF